MERISVTQAVRNFSDLLNRVYYHRLTVELERGNRVIAKLSPAPPESSIKVSGLNSFFQRMPKLGDDAASFHSDVSNIRASFPHEETPWD